MPKPPPGMCVVGGALPVAGAGPAMEKFGGGNYTAAWDGDVQTFYDYSQADGGWTEAQLTAAAAITHVEFYPRADFLQRHVVGGKFVGLRADKTEITLGTISHTPMLGWNSVAVSAVAVAEVVRVKYEGADGSFGNIAEIKLYQKCAGPAV